MSTHVMSGTLAHDTAGNRVRAVLSSESEVCHVWASGNQDHGRFRACYFSRARLYSYGSHYVIGERLADCVLLNAESNSMTTNGHRRAADHATRHRTQHWIPDLTRALRLADDIDSSVRAIASAKREGADFENPESWPARYVRTLAGERAEARRFLVNIAAETEPAALEYMAKRYGFRVKAATLKAEAERQLAAEKAANAKAEAARALADAKRFGDMSADEFGDYLPPDSYSYESKAEGYGAHAQKHFAKRIAKAHKAAKAAGYTARTRRLWQRVKLARAYAAERPARERAAYVAERKAEFGAWKAGGAKPAAWRFNGRALAAERAELDAADDAERAAVRAASFAAWKAGEGKRPDAGNYPDGSAERAELDAAERAEMESEAAKLEAWRADPDGQPKPNSAPFHGLAERFPDIAARLGGDPWREIVLGYSKAEAERRLAAEAEAERLRKATEAERAAAWIAGANVSGRFEDGNGGALLRIEGEGERAELVTSQGARVPLAHAVKAFRLVKLMRERGEAWQRNGRTLRVGHYAVDRIEPSGSFRAGCHVINWPEVERVAKLAGVFDCPAADTAEPSGH